MLRQFIQQKLQARLSPQQIQLIRMLQIPTMELDQRIKEELESNPALEEGAANEDMDHQDDLISDENDDTENENENDIDLDDFFPDDDTPDYRLKSNNHSPETENQYNPLGSTRSFHDLLESQLSVMVLENEVYNVALYIIGNLDEDGYLRRDLAAIRNDLLFSIGESVSSEVIEDALAAVQELEPAGIGARDLRECLSLQLMRRGQVNEVTTRALEVITHYFDDFTKKHFDKLAEKFECSLEELRPAIDLILLLNPKPGNAASEVSGGAQQVTPDFMLTMEEGEMKLSLNSRNAPELRVSKEYQKMFEQYSAMGKKASRDRETLTFIKQKIESARWFIDAIHERNQLLLYCMQAIIDFQSDFFNSGDESDLRPMILKDIADITGMDISTVSRISNSKFIQTPHGTYILKYFFTEGLSTDDGEEASSREVKKILREAIDGEPKDKPLADEKLMAILNSKGYNIARRTIAKYREAMGIPVARLRKTL